ncbi:hypothetical protein INT45_007193 [Circinella minor]|uniref:Uncharacterized protein n=1 Tax=Circinella minor TaxID=1195481 RepID=A0A8H7S3T0_9FUNG|nr:hypothetical protein INT45_007193 [Circinella minor]
MSVLSAVAFLNNSDERLDQQPQQQQSQPISTLSNNNKPTTEAAIKELNRIRTGGGNGVASLLSKFGNENTTLPTRPRPPSPKSPNSPTKNNINNILKSTSTNNNDLPNIRSVPTKPISAPKSMNTTKTTIKSGLTRTQIDNLSQELSILYQESVEKAEAAEEELNTLKDQIATYEADATKVRDYEIRVEYLAQKLEQVSEERDGLEQELRMFRERQGQINTPISPVFQDRLSGIFGQQDKQQQQQHNGNEYNNNDEQQQDEEDGNSEFMHDLLDAYEDDDDDDEEECGENSSFSEQRSKLEQGSIRYSDNENAPPEEKIAFLTEQLRAADQGTKIAVQHYLSELEQERLRTKTLQEVLKKQEELITTLESKLVISPTTAPKLASRPPRNASLASPTLENSSNNNSLERALREQVESQRVELEDKRTLLTQLLNEREDILKKVKLGASRPGTSSFDILAELARPEQQQQQQQQQQHYYPYYQQQRQSPIVDGRNTPPPSAPPREPLPPVPPTSATSPSKSSARGSISSFHEESIVSSVTSWSSSTAADYYGNGSNNDLSQKQKKDRPPSMNHNNFEAMYSNYMKDDMFEEEHDPYLEALRRLEGPDSTIKAQNNNHTNWNPNNMTAH